MSINSNETIALKLTEILKEEGVELIDYKLFFSRRRYILRCLLDYPGGGITIGVCAKINKKLCSFLKETNLLGEEFMVEVNSPGLDRPLKTKKDFLKVKGKTISLWLRQPYEEPSYIEGEVVGVGEHKLILKAKDKVYNLNLEQIKLGKEKIKL